MGNTIGGIVSDRILRTTGRNQFGTLQCYPCFAARRGSAHYPYDVPTTTCVSSCRFSPARCSYLELTIAPMYAIPMDVSKEYAGLGSAYVIMGVGLAGIVSPVVFGWLIDLTGNWNVPFATVAILLLGAATRACLLAGSPPTWSRPIRRLTAAIYANWQPVQAKQDRRNDDVELHNSDPGRLLWLASCLEDSVWRPFGEACLPFQRRQIL